MIARITNIEQAFAKTGAEYRKVTVVDENGKETTKSVFDNLSDRWPMIDEGLNKFFDWKMVKKGQFWNVADIKPLELPPAQPSSNVLPEHQAVIEEAISGDKMTKEDWPAKDRVTRKSIERQKALDLSVQWCIAKLSNEDVKTTHILSVAELFESYLEKGISK